MCDHGISFAKGRPQARYCLSRFIAYQVSEAVSFHSIKRTVPYKVQTRQALIAECQRSIPY